MERLFLIILIACLPILTTGQIKYDFDTSIIVGKEKQIYQQRQIKIGKDGNKYVAVDYLESYDKVQSDK